jgi:hypothetical protein
MKLKHNYYIFLLSCFALMLHSCKKEEMLTIPPSQAHFTHKTTGNYTISAPGVVYRLPIGVTTVSNQDRTVNITVTSPSGAVQGTHYTLSTTSLVIPAGKAVDSITVTGNFSQYQTGRKDTLLFKIENSDPATSDYNNTFTLIVRGPCFEGNVDLNDLVGNYINTNELFGTSAYGPYQTSIVAVTQAPGATSGTIRVANIWDAGWNPITFTLDWSNPANRTVTLTQQSGIGDGGTLHPTYAGRDISVRPFAGQVGTFSYCNQTLTLKMQLGITGLGWFASLYTVTMSR